jgi:type VI secretion system protein ImpA
MSMLDLERLLTPISPDAPCGRPIEQDENAQAVYYDMETAYKTARLIQKSQVELEKLATKALRDGFRSDKKGLPNDPAKSPDWSSVADLCCQLLYECSKDARLIGRLFEPLTRLYGLDGFIAAANGATRLVETFGSDLFPKADDDPHIVWMHFSNSQNSETFLDSLSWIRIEPHNPVCYGCKFRIETILNLPSLTADDRQELKSNSDFLDESEFNAQLALLQPETIEVFRRSLANALVAAEKLDSLLQDKAPKTEFRFNKVCDRLKEIAAWFEKILPAPIPSAGGDAGGEGEPAERSSSGSIAPKAGPVATRDDAIRQLKLVADFFRKTEPHSPLSYALEQSVRWGAMSLPDLLKEFIDNDQTLSDVYRRMGIQMKSD